MIQYSIQAIQTNSHLSNVGNSGAGLDTWADSLESRNISHNACDAL